MLQQAGGVFDALWVESVMENVLRCLSENAEY